MSTCCKMTTDLVSFYCSWWNTERKKNRSVQNQLTFSLFLARLENVGNSILFFFFVCNTNYIQGGISHLANVKSKFHASSVLFNLCDPSFSCHHLLENFSMKYDNSQRQIRVLKNYTHFFKITVKTCLKANLVAF